MPDKTNEEILEIFGEMLENLAFMFSDAVEKEEIPAAVDACMEASICYEGPSSGKLTLLAPRAVAGELAANLLGFDPEDDDAESMAQDALGELMNVTMGHMLTEMSGEEPVYNIAPPQVVDATAARWSEMVDSPLSVAYLVEDNPVLLQFSPAA